MLSRRLFESTICPLGGVMPAMRIKATVDEHGEVRLTKLPFRPGESVDIIVQPHSAQRSGDVKFPLRGTAIEYHQPTDPVALGEWEAPRLVACPR